MKLKYLLLALCLTGWLLLAGQVPTAVHAATFTVTNTNDSGPGSLRGHIADAAPNDIIVFDASLSGQTITLTSGQILINKSLTLDGSSLTERVTISGNNNGRIFYIDAAGSAISIHSLRFINGNSSGIAPGDGDGGAIRVQNSNALTITESEFADNQSQLNGGALYIDFDAGLVELTNNTFTNNSTQYAGGAVRTVSNQSVTITGNTFVGNAANEGGAIWASGGGDETVTNNTFANNNGVTTLNVWTTLYLTNNTFLGNDGVTVRNNQAFLHMRNNIIGSCIVGGGGTISTNDNNWIVDGSCSPDFSGDPKLDVLADNGGLTQTAALLPGSGAIDAGDDATCPTTDQRGMPRHDGDDDPFSDCDLGAYEAGTMICGASSATPFSFTYPDQSGVQITGEAEYSAHCLYVEEVPVSHPNATGAAEGDNLKSGVYWRLAAYDQDRVYGEETPVFTVTLALPHDNLTNAKICKYPGTQGGYGWDCFTPTTSTTTWVTLTNVTSFSEWAVGEDVGPTAVTVSTPRTTNPAPFIIPLALLGLLILSGSWLLISRKQ